MKWVWLNAFMYTSAAMFATLQTSFGSDEAAKYVPPEWLFYIKTGLGTLATGALSVKMFFSTSFADAKQGDGKAKEETKTKV